MTLFDRRTFIKSGAALAAGSVAAGLSLPGCSNASLSSLPPLRIGICSDLHHDLIFDSHERLGAFVDAMNHEEVDFIIQLGDFCFIRPENRSILDVWNRFDGPAWHVIGNHDPELTRNVDDVVDFWDMPASYYSFDSNGYHFVVLNGNDPNPHRTVPEYFNRYIGEEQLEWLENDLAATSLPTIIFTHQGLENTIGGVENGQRIRIALEEANVHAGQRKVLAVFSGHHHKDYHNVINGIHYIQINSMSYHWQGELYIDLEAFTEEQYAQFPRLRNITLYADPLWAVARISANGTMTLEGRSSDFVGRSPRELGMPERRHDYPVVPEISSREIALTREPYTKNQPV